MDLSQPMDIEYITHILQTCIQYVSMLAVNIATTDKVV